MNFIVYYVKISYIWQHYYRTNLLVVAKMHNFVFYTLLCSNMKIINESLEHGNNNKSLLESNLEFSKICLC
jgi:hypothetical protein